MHVITRKRLEEFWNEYPDAKEPLAAWFKVVEKAEWEKWADVQAVYARASYFQCCLIFNICGNSYRLVARRAARWKRIWIVGVFTHAEYDRDLWKKLCVCR